MIAQKLMSLARIETSEGRRQLLREVTDMFFEDRATRTTAEKALFEEIALRTIGSLDLDGRAEFADRLADEPEAPRSTIRALAFDDIAVARPVIERSARLEDADLIEIAQSAGTAHLTAICARTSLTSVVTDVLLERGGTVVQRLLAGHDGARFSQAGFRTLVRSAKNDNVIQLGLVRRRDLPQAICEHIVEELADSLRDLLSRIGGTLNVDLSPAIAEELRRKLKAEFRRREVEVRAVERIVADVKSGVRTLDEELPPLAALDRAFDIASIFCQVMGLDHGTIMRSLVAPSVEPLVIIMRTVAVRWPTFEAILKLRAHRMRRVYAFDAQTKRMFDTMPTETASRVVRFLRVRQTAGGEPHALAM